MAAAPRLPDEGPDPRILGRLLVAQGGLHALADAPAVAAYLARALTEVPGVGAVRMIGADGLAAPEVGAIVLPLATAQAAYGSLAITVGDRVALEPYEPYLANLANLAALVLENQRQTRLLRQANVSLTVEVAEHRDSLASLSAALNGLEAAVASRNIALSEYEGRFRLVEKAARVSTWEWDPREDELYLANGTLDALGLDASQGPTPAALLRDAVCDDDRGPLREALEAAADGRKDVDLMVRVGPEAARRWLSIHGWAMPGQDGRVGRVIGIAIDVTDRKDLERELLQADKLDSLGRLASGIAHDFNNMLTAILGFAELAADEVRGTAGEEVLGEVIGAACRAADLTRQMLAFGRRGDGRPRQVDVNALLNNTGAMLRRLIGETIDFRLVLARDLPPVTIDPARLEQAVTNIVVNARDAMPHGGTITARTMQAPLGATAAQSMNLPGPGTYVVLSISDDGAGMPEAVVQRVFEPFFTTKEAGRGTGLGLASAYGAIKAAGGCITVQSVVGEGSTFTITLPTSAAGDGHADPLRQPVTRTSGDETVLVVEDEPAIRRFIVRTLGTLGYMVLEADDGLQALEAAQSASRSIDLVIADRVLPGVGGDDVVEQLRRWQPGIGALLISGYSESPHSDSQVGRTAFLAKPFGSFELAVAVREAIDASRASRS